jgi:outer membrane protein assembly factor BamB
LAVVILAGCGWQSTSTIKAPAVKVAPVPVAVAPGAPIGRPGSDWPQFLGPTADGVSPERGIRTDWAAGLPLVWQCPLGDGYCAPTIADGRAFVFDRHGDRHRLTCRDRTTGAERWRFEYPTDYVDRYGYDGGPRCCPIVDGDRVYLYGPEGILHCLGVADGKPLWSVDTQAKYGVVPYFFGVGAAPIIEGDLLLVPVGGSPPEGRDVILLEMDPPANGSAVVAFDKRTGAEKYRTGDELASYAVPVVATIGGRRLGLYFARGGLLGFDPAGGKVEFHAPWRAGLRESVNASNPVVAGDRVLITECYGVGSALLNVRPGGCDVVWKDNPDARFKRLECHWNTPIHVDGYVYGSSGRHTNQAELRCVELESGKVMWRQPGLSRSSLTLADGHFIVLTEYGQLLLVRVSPKGYEEVGRIDFGHTGSHLLRYPCWAAPVLAHGLLYVRGEGKLLCLELIPPK